MAMQMQEKNEERLELGDQSFLMVSPEIMVHQSHQVSARIGNVSEYLEELRELVDKTRGYWVGDGADSNRTMYYDMQGTIDSIMKRLKEHPVDLIKMAITYTTTEESIEEKINQLSGDVLV